MIIEDCASIMEEWRQKQSDEHAKRKIMRTELAVPATLLMLKLKEQISERSTESLTTHSESFELLLCDETDNDKIVGGCYLCSICDILPRE